MRLTDGMRRGLALAALGLAIALASCAKKGPDYRHIADAGAVADGGERISATGAEPSTLDPILAGDDVSQTLCESIFSGLLRYGPRLTLEGNLARSWEVQDGGRTLVFHLKPGVKWHDGQPLTSADAKFTVECILDPKVPSPSKALFDLVASMDTPDPLTLVVHYKKAFAPALEGWCQLLVPRHLLKGKDLVHDGFNRQPVGTGPYKFKRWVDKQYVELEAYPDYHEGPVHITRKLLRFIPEPATRLLELKAGGIDGMGLDPDQYLKEAQGEAFDRVAEKHRFDGIDQYSYMGFNLRRAPFDDVRVRRALSLAIDRQELIDGVMQGLAQPCSGPYSPLMEAYDPSVKPMPYDLTQAARLLDQAGWTADAQGRRMKDGKPFAFKLISAKGSASTEKIVLILQQQFAKLGLQVKVETFEWSIFLSNYVDKSDFDCLVLSWGLSLDPDQYAIWHSSQTGPGQFNFIGFKDAQVDRLLEQGRTTYDHAERIRIYRAFHRRIAELQPLAFLFTGDKLLALSRKFQGLEVTKTDLDWHAATRWYVPRSVQLP